MSRKTESDEFKSLNLNACRFCLKVTRIKISIDKEIKVKFYKLMNEEVSFITSFYRLKLSQ